MKRTANSFVREYLERVSWRVLDKHRPILIVAALIAKTLGES